MTRPRVLTILRQALTSWWGRIKPSQWGQLGLTHAVPARRGRDRSAGIGQQLIGLLV
jgi:hypothetical protein